VPPNDRGLLARLDALVALVADRHGLALLPDGRLAAAEARVAARAAGLAGPIPAGPAARPGGRGRALVERDAVELLRAVAEGVPASDVNWLLDTVPRGRSSARTTPSPA
jgi:hypothetical protein